MNGWLEASWIFLFLHRPDHWIQLVLVPADWSRSAILLDPIIQVTKNSPMYCDVHHDTRGNSILGLSILLEEEWSNYTLLECRLNFGKPLGLRRWEIQRSELRTETESSSKLRWYLSWHSFEAPDIWGISSAGEYLDAQESTSLSGDWTYSSWPSAIPLGADDLIFPRAKLYGTISQIYTSYVYVMNRSCIKQYKIRLFPRTQEGTDAASILPLEIEEALEKEINWQGRGPGPSPNSCRLVRAPHDRLAGVFCQTVDDEIYLFRGNLWHQVPREPELVSAVQPGSVWIYTSNGNMIFFISPDGVLKRSQVQLNDHTGEITVGPPSPLFSENYFSITLDDGSVGAVRLGPCHCVV